MVHSAEDRVERVHFESSVTNQKIQFFQIEDGPPAPGILGHQNQNRIKSSSMLIDRYWFYCPDVHEMANFLPHEAILFRGQLGRGRQIPPWRGVDEFDGETGGDCAPNPGISG